VEADLLAANGWTPVLVRLVDWGDRARVEKMQLLSKAIEQARARQQAD
jgi:hypothetical protein